MRRRLTTAEEGEMRGEEERQKKRGSGGKRREGEMGDMKGWKRRQDGKIMEERRGHNNRRVEISKG